MEDSSGLSSSKVTVEYHDPAGVFPLLSAQLKARLPLRNLHWKSATRPVRSIDSLHVELLSAQSASDTDSRPPTSASQDSVGSQSVHRNSQANDGPAERPGSGLQPFRPLPKGRRHQIPGLRRTPYLKVYLLRCDDSETYKTISRPQIRDWLRVNVPSSKETGKRATAQENHDACEWLILHVVMPNTLASAQPRFSGSISHSTGTAKDRSNKTKWPGGKSNTIFEKVRSDFNSSSSHALDRVAQIRLQSEDLASDKQSAAPIVSVAAWQESPAELNNAWTDLIAKFKTLILESFDHRVDQYEEDIRERDAQRSLPGWNFCTFFVLKEGLARSFEGVGLVEDTLVIYDELSIGLDTAVQDKADPANDTSATTFLDSTDDMLRAVRTVTGSDDIPLDVQKLMKKPIDEYNKPYREMILQNKISVFDFRCYIFARQVSLLLRIGSASIGQLQSARTSQEARRMSLDDASQRNRSLEATSEEDLSALADICRRALVFITTVARVLRDDLHHETSGEESRPVQNFVCSWSTAVAEQILAETVSSAFGGAYDKNGPPAPLKLPRSRSNNRDPASRTSDRPARSSSLSYRPKSVIEPPYNQAAGEIRLDRSDVMLANPPRANDTTRYGLVDLANHRAELDLLQRRLLDALGRTVHWTSGWSAIEQGLNGHKSHTESLKQENGDPHASGQESETVLFPGLCMPKLIEAMHSPETFRGASEALSTEALTHYLAANQTRSAEAIYSDLAAVKYESGDFAGAVKYFERITPAYSGTKWNRVEVAMLRVQAECLKELNRKDEYIRILLVILQKAAVEAKEALRHKKHEVTGTNTNSPWLDDSAVQAGGVLRELIAYSQQLPYDVSVPMTTYFTDITIDTFVSHYDEYDGFSASMRFRHLFDEDFTANGVQLKLVGAADEQKRDILLETDASLTISTGSVDCTVHSKVTTYGSYLVEKLAVRANRILFLYEPLVKAEPSLSLSSAPPTTHDPSDHLRMTRILCYPRAGSLEARVKLSRSVDIDKARSIEIWCCVGSNDVEKLDLRLRAASAGLRLHTGKVAIIEGGVTIMKGEKPRPGIIELASVPPQGTFRLLVPYEIDSNLPEILVRIDVDYVTSAGTFQFFDHAKIPIDLPLDVNVQDNFKPFALFSTFNIRTPNRCPLQLLSVSLAKSDVLLVSGPHGAPWPQLVLPKKAASFQYIIKQSAQRPQRLKDPLSLTLEYQCFDEQIRHLAEYTASDALQQSSLTALKRLIVPFFVEQLMFHVNGEDWTQLAYRDEVPLPAFENFGWEDALDAVPPAQRSELQQWLEQLHRDHRKIWLGNIHDIHDLRSARSISRSPTSASSSDITRKLNISVSIPTLHLIPTASLQIHDYSRTYLPTDVPWPMGEAKQATLTISHSRSWGDPNELKQLAELDSEDGPLQFVYEVDCNPDIWLVGGPKRGMFSQREGDEHRISLELLIVPLRKGDWAAPTVDVRVLKAPTHEGASNNRAESPERGGIKATRLEVPGAQERTKEISCEMYYEEQFMRVLVAPQVKSTTVGLMQGDGDETVLLETRQLDASDSK